MFVRGMGETLEISLRVQIRVGTLSYIYIYIFYIELI